jgi:hypothetical protein
MKKRSGVFMVLGALSLGMVAMTPTVSSASVAAGPANFGFESGDLNQWITTLNGGKADVVSSYAGYLANEGKNFLLLTSGTSGLSTQVSQTFFMSTGEKISGSYAFYDPNNTSDYALSILRDNAEVYDVLSNASNDTSGWQTWEWTAEFVGNYTITYLLKNDKNDNAKPSYAMFDASPVPVPGALLLLGSGLMGLVGIGVRKNRPALL